MFAPSLSPLPLPLRGTESCVAVALPAAHPDRNTDTLDTANSEPQASTPPRKNTKRTRHDTPRDSTHGERSSPVKRYEGKGPPMEALPDPFASGQPGAAPHPLSLPLRTPQPATGCRSPPTPMRSNPSSHDDPRDHDPDADLPIENHPFFDPYDIASPSVSGTKPSPPPSRATTATPAPETILPAVVTSLPVAASPTSDDDPMEDDAPTFVKPTRAEWLAAQPLNRDKNPHRPSPVHDPSDAQALVCWVGFQNNKPTWNMPVIPNHIALENVDAETCETVLANPEDYLAITVFCGGSMLHGEYKNLHTDALTLLEEIADVQAHTDLTKQGTYPSNRILALHITLFDPTVSWAIMFLRTDITDPPEVTGRCLCHAAYNGWTKSPKMMSLMDRATQGGSKLLRDQRILDFVMTLEARYLPHPEDPVYVLMAQPCTKDAKLWDDIRAAARTMTYTDNLEVFIPHANASSGHNICTDCKLDCHPKYNCMFTVCDKAWWGPLDLISALRDLRGGASDNDSEGDRREPESGLGRRRTRIKKGSITGTLPRSTPVQEHNPVGRTKWLIALQLQTTSGTMFHTQGLAMGNWGTGGGESSATGTHPTDESALSRGEMADVCPISGQADATPGAVRLQGGTSTSVTAHPTQGPNQKHQHCLSQNGEPAINADQEYRAEGGLQAPGENQIPNGADPPPLPPSERDWMTTLTAHGCRDDPLPFRRGPDPGPDRPRRRSTWGTPFLALHADVQLEVNVRKE
ncbi:hypothetical protein B0H13DRAFT_1889823 [Mycena leptocephala]|nr:hypothetical protein B0H13DRAFT_1889823 [Mycena leptocephala]